MNKQDRAREQKLKWEMLRYLQKLVKWKVNNAVKLLFLEADSVDEVGKLDLTGVAEVKRSAGGGLEVKCVDKARVLGIMRELMEERRDGALEGFLDGLSETGDGDAQ